MQIVKREITHTEIYINYNEYQVTLRNGYGYEVIVSGIFTYTPSEAEEVAYIALANAGHIIEDFEAIKIERI